MVVIVVISLFPHRCHLPCLFLLSLLSTHNPPCEQVLTMVVVGAWGSSPPVVSSHRRPVVFLLLLPLLSVPLIIIILLPQIIIEHP